MKKIWSALKLFQRKNHLLTVENLILSIRKKHPTITEFPFQHIIIDDALPEKICLHLTEIFENTFKKGTSSFWKEDYFSWRAIYGSFIWTPSPKHPLFSNIFLTPEWLDFVTSFFPEIQRTNDTGLTFHHRPIKSRDTAVWNGMAYGAFKEDPLQNGINAWYNQCKHTIDPWKNTTNRKNIFYKARGIVIIYFFNNKPFPTSEEGIQLFENEKGDSAHLSIKPINNRLLIFPITPKSFYRFHNHINETNCFIQYLFENPENALTRCNDIRPLSWNQISQIPLISQAGLSTPKEKSQKTMLLIGCGGKLGTVLVKYFCTKYHIIGVSRTKPKIASLLYDFIQADISSEWDRVIKTATSRHKSIDILINNAVFYNYRTLLEQEIRDINTSIQTNLIAPFAITQKLLQKDWLRFTPQENFLRNRVVVNIGSISGTRLRDNLGQGIYSTTKAALHMMTLHLASEWIEYGIRVNAIAFHGFKHDTSPETALTAIETCLNNQDITGKIFLVSNKTTKMYSNLTLGN